PGAVGLRAQATARRAGAGGGGGAVVASGDMNSAQIRKSLRRGDSPSLRRRRKLAWLGAAALIASAVMTLFQLGALRHLPDPPGFASDAVVGPRAAYDLGTADAALDALSTSATVVRAGAGR